MTSVHIATLLRMDRGDFVPLAEVARYSGDCDYMPGALELALDGRFILDRVVWDDVNWLWPYLINALDEARRSGEAAFSFPSQPIDFRVEYNRRNGRLLLSLSGGRQSRRAEASGEEVFAAVAKEGLDFFGNYSRLCPGHSEYVEADLLRSWEDCR